MTSSPSFLFLHVLRPPRLAPTHHFSPLENLQALRPSDPRSFPVLHAQPTSPPLAQSLSNRHTLFLLVCFFPHHPTAEAGQRVRTGAPPHHVLISCEQLPVPTTPLKRKKAILYLFKLLLVSFLLLAVYASLAHMGFFCYTFYNQKNRLFSLWK